MKKRLTVKLTAVIMYSLMEYPTFGVDSRCVSVNPAEARAIYGERLNPHAVRMGFFIGKSILVKEVQQMSSAAINAKSEVVNEIKEKLQKAKSVIIVDYRGLTVSEDNDLRTQFRKAGVEYKVFKNTLVARAAKELGIEGLDSYLEGPSAFAFGYEDPVTAPKIMSDFVDKAKKAEIKGGIMDNAAITNAVVAKLAATPSKEVLLTKLMWSITGSVRNLACGLNAVKEKMEAQA